MSLKEAISECGAERRFWGQPELVENLLSFLDLGSTFELAKAHKRTRQILGRQFNFDKMIKRSFPVSENTKENCEAAEESDPNLDFAKPKVALFAQILRLVEASDGPDMMTSFLHKIIKRYPNLNPDSEHPEHVNLNCSCHLATHQVSHRGFVLLEEAQIILESRELSVLEVEAGLFLEEPLLTTLSSRARQQQEMVKELRFMFVTCSNREIAESLATLVEQTQIVMIPSWAWGRHWLVVKEVGIEGWAAVRRAVGRLSNTLGRRVHVSSQRQVMAAGRREDLRAIWDAISVWTVEAESDRIDSVLRFTKDEDGEKGGWEGVDGGRRGINAVIDMTEDDLLVEIAHVKQKEEEEEEDEF